MITSSPSLNQVMVGVGSPSALHPKVTGSFLATAVSSGCSMILGGDDEEAKIPEKKRIFYVKQHGLDYNISFTLSGKVFLRSFHIYYNDSPLAFPSVKRGKVLA